MSVTSGSRPVMEVAANDSGNSVTKRNLPDIYFGDRSKLEKWLYQMDLHFKFNKVKDTEKTEYAMTFMRGRAEEWIMVKYKQALEDSNSEQVQYFHKYTLFKGEIRRIFGVSNDEKIAEKMVQILRQKTSAADYTAEFHRYADKLDWGDDALMVMYRAGLKENVKDHLAFYAGTTDTLEKLTSAAIEIDDTLYERSLEKRRHVPSYSTNNKTYGKSSGNNYKNRNNGYGDPMEIDALQVKKPFKSRKKEGSNQSDKKCYSCGKPGHFARNCHSKNLVHRGQINMTDYQGEELEDDRYWPSTQVEEAWERRAEDSEREDPFDPEVEERRDKERRNELAEIFQKLRLLRQAEDEDYVLVPTPSLEPLSPTTREQKISYGTYAEWRTRISKDSEHPDHVHVNSNKCLDINCQHNRHQEHGISQRIAMDQKHPEHLTVPNNLCLDVRCTKHIPWYTAEDSGEEGDEEKDLPMVELVSTIEEEIGNASKKGKTVNMDFYYADEELTEESRKEYATHNRRHEDHNSYAECYDTECYKQKHIEYRREETLKKHWNLSVDYVRNIVEGRGQPSISGKERSSTQEAGVEK